MHPANSQNSTSYFERSKGGGVVFSFPTTNIWDIYLRWLNCYRELQPRLKL